MLRTAAVLIVCLAAGALPAGASAQAPNVHWESTLAPAPSPLVPQPGPQAGCAVATASCVEDVVAQLRTIRAQLACDHRGVFATAYMVLTEHLLAAIRDGDPAFDDLANLIWQDVRFAAYYYDALDGAGVPPAWRSSFDVAARGDATAVQDMLLGINAHIQRDLPFVLADLGLREPDGTSRKPDYDRINDVLSRAFQDVVSRIAATYDPFVATVTPQQAWAEDFLALEMVRGWREGAWRNAERLLGAGTVAQRALVVQSIESNAQAWATFLTFQGTGPPGWRAQRDAFCAANFTP